MSQQTYRLTISYNAAGQFCQNVMTYKFEDSAFTTTVLAADALISAWRAHCETALKAALPAATTLLSYKARRVTGSGGFEAVQVVTAGTVGGRAGNVSASGLSPIIRFICNGVPAKSGRIYLPGISDSDVADSYIQPTLYGLMQTLADKLDDTITLTGGGSPLATHVLLTHSPIEDSIPIAEAVPANWLGTQRRRQRPA